MQNRRWVVMGVSGSGKSTLGQLLAERLALPFVEGDDCHPPANIAKMQAGEALDDTDRLPWLLRLQSHLTVARQAGTGLVLTCSALKRGYRDLLRSGDPDAIFLHLHLHGNAALFADRLADRNGHFMPATLLPSQVRDLEPLASGEGGLRLDPAHRPEQLLEQIFRVFGEKI